MLQDPLYAEIEQRLRGDPNPETFELCAADLLQQFYPGLAPIPGGADAGMDGAIPDDEGPPLPLVSTTAQNVIRNLTRNLERYREEGGEAREAVVATTTFLTPRRRQNLHDRADQFDFTLRNVHDGSHFVLLLYRDADWRLELLGLSGDLPALSAVAITARPSPSLDLVGRNEIVGQLRDSTGPSVLVGQPGSGKTAVLQQLALEEVGLFVVSDDIDRVADDVRRLEPPALFVDDAHRRPGLLLELRRLKEEIGAGFRIVATSWPADVDRDQVLRNLDAPPSASIELPRLARNTMEDVVRNCGVSGPPRLIGEILDQAEGLPGLAVTLARLSLREGTEELVAGEFLLQDLRQVLTDRVGGNVIPVLAAFALGGAARMPMVEIAEHLGRPLDELYEIVTQVEAGGILRQVDDGVLAVEPDHFRWALVREVFFGESTTLPVQPLLDSSPDLAATALTLVHSRHRGASIPDQLIHEILEACESPDSVLMTTSREAWRVFAWLGPAAVDWTLDEHPEHRDLIVRPALVHRPQRMLPHLLDAAVTNETDPSSHPDHPMRKIQDWVAQGRPGTSTAVRRRSELLDALARWYDQDEEQDDVTLSALATVLDPEFRAAPTDPVSRESVTFTAAYLTADELTELMERWPDVLTLMGRTELDFLDDLDGTVRKLIAPSGMAARHLSEETRSAAREAGERILRDVAQLGAGRPGVVAWARRLAEMAELDLELPEQPEPEFEILYPPRTHGGDWRERRRQRQERARELGHRWTTEPPEEVAARLARYEEEASRFGDRFSRLIHVVTRTVAEDTSDAVAWVAALTEAGCSPEALAPFVRPAFDSDAGLREVWNGLVDEPRYRHLIVMEMIRTEHAPDDLLDEAIQHLDGLEQLVETSCIRGELSDSRVRRLLEEAPPGVARAAAEGLWRGPSVEPNHEAVWDAWRSAIVEFGQSHHVLQEVFGEHPDIALDWLLHRFDDPPVSAIRISDSLKAALRVLDRAQRMQLIEQAPPDFSPPGFLRHLIGDDSELYEALLDRPELEAVHLYPLRRRPDEGWARIAIVALEAGYDPEDVAQAAFMTPMQWTGQASDMWGGWVGAFRTLEDADDRRLREAGRIGRQWAEGRLEQAEEQEHMEAVRGVVR